ncbi:hypothetical protein [Desulfovibrio legallii]|uniref:Uncharacterized protein n=1 Tax=Desulfovibrio legallii TaxID=571438 RepID=A0A6H3FDJ7_9BACT|nr:hypothetical protein [Desulfovibrio legallii]RHH23562.1 hypothetical protein DW219_05510 [Desulfovibrio sp. AM18-2]TBH79471.1 hypothetical protein EB812_07695 [Desulfovibrio legallii]CAI3240123.1 hypothetical protein DWUX_2246 [Desulfovibrio diazotrophicus]
MAIIDRNAVFFEGSLTANATGNTVALTACKLPGRMEPMPLRLSVTEAFLPAEVQNLSIDMEQAAQPDGPWTSVPGGSVSIAHSAAAPTLDLGARPYLRFLPQGARQPYLRLRFSLTPVSGQNVSQGRIFAALTREEDLPYEAALMVR